MVKQLVVVKLGGSVITEKKKLRTPSYAAINEAMRDIAESGLKTLVLIHGGGSFGHPIAKEHSLQNGFRDSAQILGIAKTRQAMMELNKIVIDAGLEKGLPCISIVPSSFIQTKGKRIVNMDTHVLTNILNLGMIPVLFGDVVTDDEIGFCVLSGDQLAAKIATDLNASRVILTTDVDGVYDGNPKLDPRAKLIQVLDAEWAEHTARSGRALEENVDATGGMFGKILEMLPVAKQGKTVLFINGRKPGILLRALRGETTIGTIMR